MEDESIQKDEEKLKSLLETLKKNDENVPKELLKTKYKKPYRELKDSIKEVADQISGRRIRQDIVIKNDDAGQVLIKQIQEMIITAGACHILAEGLKNKEEADGMQSSDTNR